MISFFTGSAIGLLYEVTLHVIRDGSFVNHGMLHRPWLPIYGLGCLIVVWLKNQIDQKPVIHFLISTLICGIIEYFTSWSMEQIYHVR